tara:strand:+ start:780 stop:2075 length:1296 start_codon:yes stop_codon:yes gene_type:complete
MRNNIVHIGADELTYEIRGIVDVARKVEELGQPITWENIGDPVAKGEIIPRWITDIVKEKIDTDGTFAYGPTKGLQETRDFLAKKRSAESGISINAEDIIFFNGLGDAISKIYNYLNRGARIIGPTPAYSTHSSAEAAHAGTPHITYTLNPERNWLPDIDDLRNKVRYNPAISGILIINPDNPTGMVYPKKILKEIVSIAKEYDLFIVCDEIYAHLAYGDTPMTALAEVINDVPALVLRGISKELPWPGARCGWVEVYNSGKDEHFDRYVQTVNDAKMLEVCSTTLPQKAIPDILGDKRYTEHLEERSSQYAKRADEAYKILRGVSGIIAPKPSGAFYLTAVFTETLSQNAKLPIENKKIRSFIEEQAKNVSVDKRFAYYLMGATGICVVPLSGFNSDLFGFRSTLLENSQEKFTWIYKTIAESIKAYRTS